jgi:hypothetical protein
MIQTRDVDPREPWPDGRDIRSPDGKLHPVALVKPFRVSADAKAEHGAGAAGYTYAIALEAPAAGME